MSSQLCIRVGSGAGYLEFDKQNVVQLVFELMSWCVLVVDPYNCSDRVRNGRCRCQVLI
jgi:hypothetical protein